jgi:hypothetical protein
VIVIGETNDTDMTGFRVTSFGIVSGEYFCGFNGEWQEPVQMGSETVGAAKNNWIFSETTLSLESASFWDPHISQGYDEKSSNYISLLTRWHGFSLYYPKGAGKCVTPFQ